MIAKVTLHKASQEIVHADAVNTYQKGDMYCVRVGDQVYKYPLASIFRVIETY